MFKRLIPTFFAAAFLFAGASLTALACDESGYKATQAPQGENGAGMSSMAGNETSVGGSSLADSAGNDTSLGLDNIIVQGTGTSEQ